MFENDDDELINLIRKDNSSHIPENMELYIRNGIKLGVKRKQKNKIKYLANAAAILLIIVFLSSIRISSTFASYVEKMPILVNIVEIVNYDKGIKDILKNNFVENIDTSIEKEGIIVILNDMIIDNSKAIIFYTIENKSNPKSVDINFNLSKVKDEKGKESPELQLTGGYTIQDMSKGKKTTNSMVINFNKNTVIPQKIILDLKLGGNGYLLHNYNVLKSTWRYKIPINTSKFKAMENNYPINYMVEIQGQKILFKTVTVTPTRISVDVEYDKKNTKKIFKFEDIAIMNELGEKWSLANGDSENKIDEYNSTLYFSSNYYSKSKRLYLTGSSVRAVDKDKATLEIDLVNKKLINGPDDKLKLVSIISKKSKTTIKLNLQTDKKIEPVGQIYSLSDSVFKDAHGKAYNFRYFRCGIMENGMQSMEYVIPDKTKTPIYMPLVDYPLRIKGSFKIKIK